MERSTREQAASFLKRATNVLVALPANPSTDAIAAGLALFLALEKLGTLAKVVSPGFTLPPNHGFLPKSESIVREVPALRKFVITVDVSKAPIDELSYEVADGKLRVYLTPKGAMPTVQDVKAELGAYAYDAIVTLDCPTFDALGPLFDANAEFFYQTPLLNLDHSPANEEYGQINLVDIGASSTSEILFEVLQGLRPDLLDETLATALLTGIISKTKSFRTTSVTPKALSIASLLVNSGARREEIIRNLYQSKSLSTLKLWGHALTRLESAHGDRLLWTTITQEDIAQSGVTPDDVPGVIDELIVNSPRAEIVAVIVEAKNGVRIYCSALKAIDLTSLLERWKPAGSPHHVRCDVPNLSLEQARGELEQLTQAYFTSSKSF